MDKGKLIFFLILVGVGLFTLFQGIFLGDTLDMQMEASGL